MVEPTKPARREPPKPLRRPATTAATPGVRRVAPQARLQGQDRARLVFSILGLLVIASMLFGLVATGFTFGLGGDPTPDSGLRAPAGSSIVPTYEARLRENPQDSGTMIVLANILQNQGDYPGAIDWYEKAVALRPDDVDLRLAFGQALYAFGQLFDAEVQYKKAIELDGKSAKAEYYLAELYQRWTPPRLAEAREHFQRTSDLEPEGSWGRAARTTLDRLNATPVPATATP
ncbi:MAG TPA: tetratricopeptide repeat protein [Thermomicrobiales bacterium]|jgi:hypothetical protein